MASEIFAADSCNSAEYQDPVDVAILNDDINFGYKRRIGKKCQDDCPAMFPDPIMSWDVHVYFDSSNEDSIRHALNLRWSTLTLFPNLTVNRPYRTPIGPHPCAMWSCELHTPSQFAAYLPWLSMHRCNLSVLIHPLTGNDLLDHTDNCFWMGDRLALNLSVLN